MLLSYNKQSIKTYHHILQWIDRTYYPQTSQTGNSFFLGEVWFPDPPTTWTVSFVHKVVYKIANTSRNPKDTTIDHQREDTWAANVISFLFPLVLSRCKKVHLQNVLESLYGRVLSRLIGRNSAFCLWYLSIANYFEWHKHLSNLALHPQTHTSLQCSWIHLCSSSTSCGFGLLGNVTSAQPLGSSTATGDAASASPAAKAPTVSSLLSSQPKQRPARKVVV